MSISNSEKCLKDKGRGQPDQGISSVKLLSSQETLALCEVASKRIDNQKQVAMKSGERKVMSSRGSYREAVVGGYDQNISV